MTITGPVPLEKGGAGRRGVDLALMRTSTAATLVLVVVLGGFLQFTLGVNAPIDFRMLVLITLTVVALALALAATPLLLRSSGGASPGHPVSVALLVSALAVWAVALAGPFAGWSWAYTLAIAGGVLTCLVAGWRKVVAVLATCAAIGLGGLASIVGRAGVDADNTGIVIGTLLLFTVMPLSSVWVLQLVLRLDSARRIEAELAVATERLRFATDLHDIQGHNLQVIALKSELAERLLISKPRQAAEELASIRVIARTALDDTRAVVNDYRTVTVAVEVRNAAAVLRSAGIRCQAHIDAPGMPTDVGAVFAVAIREAATNMLRHSRAMEATIELISVDDEYRLTVVNDGAASDGLGSGSASGTGLAGLAERVAAVRGTVESGRLSDGFSLVVRVPRMADA